MIVIGHYFLVGSMFMSSLELQRGIQSSCRQFSTSKVLHPSIPGDSITAGQWHLRPLRFNNIPSITPVKRNLWLRPVEQVMLLAQRIAKVLDGLFGVEHIPRVDASRPLAGFQHEK